MIEPVRKTITVDGQQLSYQEAGPSDGPVVLLLHGLLSESSTWEPALAPLAALGLRAIALDLVGHGASDKPPLEYSLADFADSIGAFAAALDLGPVTLIGHSLGGAIAMQFARSHPSQLARLGLVSAGGLGKQVHFILRAVSLPGVPALLRATVNPRTARMYSRPELHRALRLGPTAVTNLGRMGRSLMSDDGRDAFVSATRFAIKPRGQLGNMIEHGFVPDDLPTLIIWSAHDPVIPVSHAIATHEALPNSRLELFAASTHEPHRREPERFADAVARFITETDPASPPTD